MKNSPALLGGLLKGKPTWPNAFGCSATSAYLFSWCKTFGIHPRKTSMPVSIEVNRLAVEHDEGDTQ